MKACDLMEICLGLARVNDVKEVITIEEKVRRKRRNKI